jgi:hypothetical protein
MPTFDPGSLGWMMEHLHSTTHAKTFVSTLKFSLIDTYENSKNVFFIFSEVKESC